MLLTLKKKNYGIRNIEKKIEYTTVEHLPSMTFCIKLLDAMFTVVWTIPRDLTENIFASRHTTTLKLQPATQRLTRSWQQPARGS